MPSTQSFHHGSRPLKRSHIPAIAVFLAFLIAACGGEDQRPAAGDEPAGLSGGPRRSIAITDSIGVELGDSNYVFGAIDNVCFGPDGNLYVFDLSRAAVMVYGPDGEFVGQIARRGEGPGEISYPLSMTVLNNGTVIICALGGFHNYSPEGEFLGVTNEYYQNPPMNLAATGDSSMLAAKLSIVPDEDAGALVDFWVGRFDGPGEPAVRFVTDRIPFDPQDLTGMLERTWMAYCITGDLEGRAYLAPRSSEEFRIDVYSLDGELARSIRLDVPRAGKTEEEIQEEKDWMEMHLTNMGVSGVVIEYEPDPFRTMIRDLGVDAEGRIWARRGTELDPVFEVFSLQGEHLFTAEIPGVGDQGQFWRFEIDDHGMAAFSTNPDLYQQVYLLQLQEGT